MKPHVPGRSGKKKYGDRATADAVASHALEHGKARLYVYHCDACHCWDLTGMTPDEHQRGLLVHFRKQARTSEGSGPAIPEDDEATVEAMAEAMWRQGPLVDLFPGWQKAGSPAQDNFRAYARAAIRAINKLRGGTP